MNILQTTVALPIMIGLASTAQSQEVRIPSGTTLRIDLEKPVRLRVGAEVTGHLSQPIYIVDREVVPAGASVVGHVRSLRPGPGSERAVRLLAADFTPPRIPNIVFERIDVPAHAGQPASTIQVDAPAEVTDARRLTIGVQQKKRSIRGTVGDSISQAKDEAKRQLKDHHYVETVQKWAINQLPYHPQFLWRSTHFNAPLSQDSSAPDVTRPTYHVEELHGSLPQGTLRASLVASLSSARDQLGDAVDAVITRPLFSTNKTSLIVPEGAVLHGKVVQVKPARWFGRNGSLRFTFASLDIPGAKTATTDAASASQTLEVHGRLSAAETSEGEHIKMDEEGQVTSSDGPGKYAEPLILGALAIASAPDDHDQGTNAGIGSSTVASNGFGLIARVVSLTTRDRNVVQGFAYYALAKSVYFRFIARGHQTTFPRGTEIEVALSKR
jgi:hypothetical protein